VPDRTIVCVDCGNEFVFTEREQEWYREKGLAHEPRRCKPCRTNRKSGSGPSRPPGDSGAPSSGHEDHGAAGGHADRPRRPSSSSREMHSVACATCGKETEVPFRPDPTRPVYCRDCYVARGKKR
jgi:CxxC-x17-CxxC domain-containing protein